MKVHEVRGSLRICLACILFIVSALHPTALLYKVHHCYCCRAKESIKRVYSVITSVEKDDCQVHLLIFKLS